MSSSDILHSSTYPVTRRPPHYPAPRTERDTSWPGLGWGRRRGDRGGGPPGQWSPPRCARRTAAAGWDSCPPGGEHLQDSLLCLFILIWCQEYLVLRILSSIAFMSNPSIFILWEHSTSGKYIFAIYCVKFLLMTSLEFNNSHKGLATIFLGIYTKYTATYTPILNNVL